MKKLKCIVQLTAKYDLNCIIRLYTFATFYFKLNILCNNDLWWHELVKRSIFIPCMCGRRWWSRLKEMENFFLGCVTWYWAPQIRSSISRLWHQQRKQKIHSHRARVEMFSECSLFRSHYCHHTMDVGLYIHFWCQTQLLYQDEIKWKYERLRFSNWSSKCQYINKDFQLDFNFCSILLDENIHARTDLKGKRS